METGGGPAMLGNRETEEEDAHKCQRAGKRWAVQQREQNSHQKFTNSQALYCTCSSSTSDHL